MTEEETCAFCESQIATLNRRTLAGSAYFHISVSCPRCGSFIYTDEHEEVWKTQLREANNRDRLIANTSGWLYEHQGIKLIKEHYEKVFPGLRTPSLYEKTIKLLRVLESRSEFIGHYIPFSEQEFLAITWSINRTEVSEILNYLINKRKWIERQQGPDGAMWELKIAPNGWSKLEDLREINPQSTQGFIAMNFDPPMRASSEAIKEAVEKAGYKPLRVDDDEHIDKIDDKIIADIRKSRFVVADFTGQKSGVYYEAGYALGLGLPVIWTCEKSEINKLHFDIRQYNCIDWEDHDDLKVRLTNRIEAILGHGPYTP
ncbi:MAG: hypothetical protein JRD68_03295 [Deltaproteobacteria bacterium]|nr:hypothetical protein [Deltaproteobacteria bacterium]